MKNTRTKHGHPGKHGYTKAEMIDMSKTVSILREYIYPLLFDKQNGKCAACSTTSKPFDVDHKRYDPMATIDDLQLLCVSCHSAKHPDCPMLPYTRRG